MQKLVKEFQLESYWKTFTADLSKIFALTYSFEMI